MLTQLPSSNEETLGLLRTVETYVGIIMANMGSFFKEKQKAAGRGGLRSYFGPSSGCILSLLDALERRILLARGRGRKKENNKMRKNGVE